MPAAALTDGLSAVPVIITAVSSVSICFAKLSLFMLYLRLLKVDRITRWLVQGGIATCSAVYFASGVAFVCICTKRPWERWHDEQMGDRCTRQSLPLCYLTGIFGLVSDVYLFLLPIPIVWGLQMPLRQRMGILAIFATGIM